MILNSMLQHSPGVLFALTALATLAYGFARLVSSVAAHVRRPRSLRR